MCLQDFGEQVVIAIPLALVVERNDEQVASLQGLQHPFAILCRFGRAETHGIAQRAAQSVEYAGLL